MKKILDGGNFKEYLSESLAFLDLIQLHALFLANLLVHCLRFKKLWTKEEKKYTYSNFLTVWKKISRKHKGILKKIFYLYALLSLSRVILVQDK